MSRINPGTAQLGHCDWGVVLIYYEGVENLKKLVDQPLQKLDDQKIVLLHQEYE